jgi:hypothetical protein
MEMRHQQYFLSRFETLVECFPSMKSKTKIERIYNFLKDIPKDGIDEIINTIIDNFKYAPTPSDFFDAATAWKKKNNYYNQVIEAQYTKIGCDYCFDTGIVKFEHTEPDGFQYLIRCDCETGKTNNSNMPRWDSSLKGGFVKKALNAAWFNPNITPDTTEELANEKIMKKVNEWKKQIKRSEKYWTDLGYENT